MRVWAARRGVLVWVSRRRINELRWLRVGTDSIDENVGRPVVGAWIENLEGKVMAGKMPALPGEITLSTWRYFPRCRF